MSPTPYTYFSCCLPSFFLCIHVSRSFLFFHFIIPNNANVGIGKGKSYCTVEEFKEHKLRIDNIDLSNVWSELNYFIKPVVTKNIFDFVKKEEATK